MTPSARCNLVFWPNINGRFFVGLLRLSLGLGVYATALAQGPEVAQLRYLSTIVRDVPPSVDEAKNYYQASDKRGLLKTYLDAWLASAEHQERVRRYFNDMFGMEYFAFIADDFFNLYQYDATNTAILNVAPFDLSESGVYFLNRAIKSQCGSVVTSSAWWADSPIKICSSALSDHITASNWQNNCMDAYSATGLRHANCGCGPEQFICFPGADKGKIVAGVTTEFRERALYVYEQGLSWLELFGGDLFVGDRWLYHHYLYQSVVGTGQPPTTDELARLKTLPIAGQGTLLFSPNLPERSGVVTAPGFMRRFNNFRSRVRALTNNLLCKDIDGSLDTTAAAQGLVNPTLSDFDREHGTREACSSCHYPMDNFGSLILHWSDQGFFEAFKPSTSQAGWAFGEAGAGPQFLMRGYVERSGGVFQQCMARRAFEDFSGLLWDDLAAEEQSAFLALADAGPKSLLQGILASDVVLSARLPKAGTQDQDASALDFARDVDPILQRSCAGAACHGEDSARGQQSIYVGNAALFNQIDQGRIESGSMPPAGSGVLLTPADKATLLRYLQQAN